MFKVIYEKCTLGLFQQFLFCTSDLTAVDTSYVLQTLFWKWRQMYTPAHTGLGKHTLGQGNSNTEETKAQSCLSYGHFYVITQKEKGNLCTSRLILKRWEEKEIAWWKRRKEKYSYSRIKRFSRQAWRWGESEVLFSQKYRTFPFLNMSVCPSCCFYFYFPPLFLLLLLHSGSSTHTNNFPEFYYPIHGKLELTAREWGRVEG